MDKKELTISAASIALVAALGYFAYTDLSVENLTGSPLHQAQNAAAVSSAKTVAAEEKAVLNVSVSTKIKRQDILAGTADFTAAEYILDAKKSQKDIVVSAIKTLLTMPKNSAISFGCALWDGNTQVSAPGSYKTKNDVIFNMTDGLLIPKGTVKTLSLKCTAFNNPSSPVATFSWGIKRVQNQIPMSVVANAAGDDQTIIINISPSLGVTMTLRTTGELTIARDPATPASGVVKCDQANAPMLKIRMSAAYEDISIKTLGFLVKSSSKAISTPITKLYLYSENQKIGEGASAKIAINDQFIIPKGG